MVLLDVRGQMRVSPLERIPNEPRVRASRFSSCHSSSSKIVLRAWRIKALTAESSAAALGTSDEPVSISPTWILTRRHCGSASPWSRYIDPSGFGRNGAKLRFLNKGAASENPNLTPNIVLSVGNRHTAQPLSLTAKICSQYFVSVSISFSSRVADARIASTLLLRLWTFHPRAIFLLSNFCSGVIGEACNLSVPSVPIPTFCLSSADIVRPACTGASFEMRRDILSSANRDSASAGLT